MEAYNTYSRDVVRCELCEQVIEVTDWPKHRDAHIITARANPEDPMPRFCENGQSGTILLCRRKRGHHGKHAGPLGELRWESREIA